MKIKCFSYQGRIYTRSIPVKRLFNSNLIHQVVTRGDVFATQLSTGELTIIPADAEVLHFELEVPAVEILSQVVATATPIPPGVKEELRARRTQFQKTGAAMKAKMDKEANK